MQDMHSWLWSARNQGAHRWLPGIGALCLLICITSACTTSAAPPTASPNPTLVSSPPAATTSASPASLPTAAPTTGFVVTVLATDVGLWEHPDTRGGNVTVSFTVNGNAIQTIVYVSGEVPVLETNVPGVDGKTRWTGVRYSGHVGPLDTGTSFTVAGYLRNDLISAPHAPGAPAVRNP